MAQLAGKELVLGYEGHVLVNKLSFEVNCGDYLCIVGENGAGKSTLMRTLLGLQEPLGGQVIAGDGLKAGKIGYLPQQTQVQRDFPASVWEIVLSGCLNCGKLRFFYGGEQKARAELALKEMGIIHLARHCYRELSGGQQQRVLLARALCAAGEMLMLDEPVAGLDPQAMAELYRLIRRLNQDKGITILMVSHDITAAVRYASHILHVGKTSFFGTGEAYKNSRIGRRFLADAKEDLGWAQ